MSTHVKCNVTVFLLQGKVQGVKMRRYVESAARHFGVGGYVINVDDNDEMSLEKHGSAVTIII